MKDIFHKKPKDSIDRLYVNYYKNMLEKIEKIQEECDKCVKKEECEAREVENKMNINNIRTMLMDNDEKLNSFDKGLAKLTVEVKGMKEDIKVLGSMLKEQFETTKKDLHKQKEKTERKFEKVDDKFKEQGEKINTKIDEVKATQDAHLNQLKGASTIIKTVGVMTLLMFLMGAFQFFANYGEDEQDELSKILIEKGVESIKLEQ